MTVDELKLEIEKLDENDRATIYYYLIDIDGGFDDASEEDIEAAWIKECQQRVSEIESSEVELIPASDVHAKARTQASERQIARVRARTA